MTVRKQNFPSFASIISVISIILFCLGFLRVEVELNDQKKRLNALENVADTKASSSQDFSLGKIVLMLTLEALIDVLFRSRFLCFVSNGLCPM